MSYLLTCKIEINGLVPFYYTDSVKIESGWDTLSDTCTISLPNFSNKLEKQIKAGERIRVWLGYNNQNHIEFDGYIAEISPKIPFVLTCEDGFYKLKRDGSISKSYRNIKLDALLKELVPNISMQEVPNVTLENFQIRNATKAQVLEELKDKYGLSVYFRGLELYCGLPFFDNPESELHVFDFTRNVVSEEDLTYQRSEDVRILAKATSILRDNTRIEVEVGDTGGEQRTFFYTGITETSELKRIVEADIQRSKYEGYRGSIKTFGQPFVKHSDRVLFIDEFHPERPQGRYFVNRVETSFGDSGFKRDIKIGKKL